MFHRRAVIQLISVIAAVILATVARADDLAWIQGEACSSSWTIEPAQPRDTDAIRFSGPVRFYLNRCVAERSLGGRPTMRIDHFEQTIELEFVPPPSEDCTGFWGPVCGLAGSLGPLGAGHWRLFSSAPGATFSLEFAVGEDVPASSVYYVDPNAPGAMTGSSWRDAFHSLQDALAAAGDTGEIRVAQGTYRPNVGVHVDLWDRSAMFQLNKSIVLKGGYAGCRSTNPNSRDILAFQTILSGDLSHDDKPLRRLPDLLTDYTRADNSYHIVSISGTDAAAALDGFTITGGIDTDSELPDELGGGGGIYNDCGNATIRNCLIIGNATLHRGGGFYSRGNCTPVFIDCTIANNWSTYAGGAIYYHWNSDLILSRCVITGNGTEFFGGGICGQSDGQLLVSNSILSGNRATDSTWSRGGGVYGCTTDIYLNHCTLIGNQAAVGSALACELFSDSDTSQMHASNCIVWGDEEPVFHEENALVEIVASDVRGGWVGQGNIDADPAFVQAGQWDNGGTVYDPCDDTWTDGDYHLRRLSPCVDAGSLAATWDPNGMDLDRQARVSGVAADMGAYELRNDPPVANAGPDVTGFALASGGKGTVTLDASNSYDPEGLALHHRWYCNGQLVSEQARFTTDLSAGVYTFRLEVSDGMGQTVSDEAIVMVTLVVHTKTFVSPQKMKRRSSKDIITMTVLPKGKLPKDFDMAEPLLLFPGGIPATKQSALVWMSGDVLVMGTFKRADAMAAVPTNGPVEMRIVGRLKDGQHFSAVDNVTIQ